MFQQPKYIRRFEQIIYLLIFAAVLVQMLQSFPMAKGLNPHCFNMSDEAVYAWQAEKISNNFKNIFSPQINKFHPPLFPVLLGLGKTIFHDLPPITAYRYTALSIGLLSLLILFLLGVNFSGPFLGVFCALGMTKYYVFNAYKFFILNDILLMLSITLFFLVLAGTHPNSSWKKHATVGLTATLAIASKWTGILLLPIIFAYYTCQPSRKLFLKGLQSFAFFPGSILALSIFALSLSNFLHTHSWLPDLSALPWGLSDLHINKGIQKEPLEFFSLYYTPFKPFLFFFALGAVISCLQKNKFLIFLTIFVLMGITVNSFISTNDPRYVIYLQPFILLLAGHGIETFVKLLLQKPLIIMSAKFIFIFYYTAAVLPPHANTLVQWRFQCIDLFPAYQWIKDHAHNDDLVFSQEPRTIRYFSGMDFIEEGGRLSGCPPTRQGIAQAVHDTSQGIILEVNRDRENSRSDFKPFSSPDQTEQFLHELGFELKENFYPKEGKTEPIIKIYQKPKDF